jgi:hypothetical protein
MAEENRIESYVEELHLLNEKYELLEEAVYRKFREDHLHAPGYNPLNLERLDLLHMAAIRKIDGNIEERILALDSLNGERILGLDSLTMGKIAEIFARADERLSAQDERHFDKVVKELSPDLKAAYEKECRDKINPDTGIPSRFSADLARLNERFLKANSAPQGKNLLR